MPRPFDESTAERAAPVIEAPWAEPVANDPSGRAAPEPAVAAARIRHVSASVQSPSGPLKWKVRDEGSQQMTPPRVASRPVGSAVRPIVHLQTDSSDEAVGAASTAGESLELNAPQGELRTAQAPELAPPDPAVPADAANSAAPPQPPSEPPPPTEDPTPLEAPKRKPAKPELGAPRGRSQPKLPAESAVPPDEPAPRSAPWIRDRDGKAPCERLYGPPDQMRNCCDEEALCGEARRRVKLLTISKIKVDITPTCNLAGEWNDAPETKCGWQLELSPPRTWKDRVGKEVARGRFSGFANARVIIADDKGETTKIKLLDLSEDDRCFVTAWCGLPFECGLVEEPLLARTWQPLTMTWKASGLCHKPLYFEEVQVERYGHTLGPIVQPVWSGAHFFANIALLPYNMGVHPFNECQYALGYYRPGSCAPRQIPPFPLSARGALLEAGTIVGGVYLLP